MQYPSKYIVWDLETSGLDRKTDKILEIGAIKVENGEVIEERNWILKHPDFAVPAHITEITGITQDIHDSGRDPEECIKEFLALFEGFSWANLTHNGFRFDIEFLLTAILWLRGFEWDELRAKMYNGMIDTAVMYKADKIKLERRWNENFVRYAARVMDVRAPGVKYNVKHCCTELGIETAGETMHRALGDARLTNRIFRKMVT